MSHKMGKVLVVGAARGLGRYLCELWGADSLLRGQPIPDLSSYDLVVHAAARAGFRTSQEVLFEYVQDNLLLIEQIAREQPKKLVYISSIDVYPKDIEVANEDADFALEDISSGYPSFKLMAEAIVKKYCENHLILRPSALFGPQMRPNNVVKLIEGLGGLSLSSASQFNCVTYDMIASLVETAHVNSVTGVVNCAARDAISLAEIAKRVGYLGDFGKHEHKVIEITNQKAMKLEPKFARSSVECLADIWPQLQ